MLSKPLSIKLSILHCSYQELLHSLLKATDVSQNFLDTSHLSILTVALSDFHIISKIEFCPLQVTVLSELD